MTLLDTLDVQPVEETTLSRERRRARGVISTDFLPRFEHISAGTVEEAAFLLGSFGHRAALIAGGTDLLRHLKSRACPLQPDVLINIKSISKPSLNYIVEDSAGLRIGSLTTLHHIEISELLREKYGILARAAQVSGAPQHRHMATLGGSLCQQVRCWYYRASRNAFFCYRKGGNECYALDGDNRYHAVFGGECCFAVCPSDVAIALTAAGAEVKIFGMTGERAVPLEEFFTTLGNALKPDEILTEVRIPAPVPDSQGVFVKFGLRNELDPAIVSVAAVAAVEDGVCRSMRIVLGGVSPIPWIAVKAGEMLVGDRISRDRAESAARAVVEGATPLRMNAYKLDLIEALVKRAVLSFL